MSHKLLSHTLGSQKKFGRNDAHSNLGRVISVLQLNELMFLPLLLGYMAIPLGERFELVKITPFLNNKPLIRQDIKALPVSFS